MQTFNHFTRTAPTVLVAAFLATITPIQADVPASLAGKTEFDVVSCAGAPLQIMDFAGQGRIYVYGSSTTTSAVPLGDMLFFKSRANTCQATVIFRNGYVADVKYQKGGGLISREVQCMRLFSGCESPATRTKKRKKNDGKPSDR